MDTQHLQAFVAIAENGSFSAAGERLHLTQPAISKRIALLEEQIKAKLFDRVLFCFGLILTFLITIIFKKVLYSNLVIANVPVMLSTTTGFLPYTSSPIPPVFDVVIQLVVFILV